MSDKASIVINSVRDGKDKSMSVGYINPNATPQQLITFAQGINSLTQNTYQGTTLVEKTDLVVKPEPTLNIFDGGDERQTPLTSVSFAQMDDFCLQVQ